MSGIISEEGNWPVGRGRKTAAPQPTIEIKLDHHFTSRVYTSGSTITGEAVICTLSDVAFTAFDIIFAGVAATMVHSIDEYKESFWRFMTLNMPINNGCLPNPKIFEAGRAYTVPFNFVVPHQLTIGACNHKCSDVVLEQHLRPPPTMGFWEGDDQAPRMTQIKYSIKARIIPSRKAGCTVGQLMETSRMIKVLPALQEDAPLDVTSRDDRYTLSRTRKIRNSLFSPKNGEFTAAAHQPQAVMLTADGHETTASSVRVNLKFVPSLTEATPPKINAVSGKLVSTTFFSTNMSTHIPTITSQYTASTLSYRTNNKLFHLPVNKVLWTRQQQPPIVRRDSGYSSDDPNCALEAVRSKRHSQLSTEAKDTSKPALVPTKYTAALNIPIKIPNSAKKIFLPTFHSCLISRAYTLQLSFSVGATNTEVSLALPLQIGVDSIYEPYAEQLPSFESIIAQDGEEAGGQRLSGRRQSLCSTAQNNILPPGYEASRQVFRVT